MLKKFIASLLIGTQLLIVPVAFADNQSLWTDEEYKNYWNEKVLTSEATFFGTTVRSYSETWSEHAGFRVDDNYKIIYNDIGPNVHNFNFEDYESSKWIKPLTDDLLKELLYYAKERGHYVDLDVRNDLGGEFFQIRYLAHPNDLVNGSSIFRIDLWKSNTTDINSKPYDMTISIESIAPSRTVHNSYNIEQYMMKVNNENYTFTEFLDPIKFAFTRIFGQEDGEKFYNYALSEYRTKKADDTMSTYRDKKYYFYVGNHEIEQSDISDRASKSFMHTIYRLDYSK